MILTPCIAGIPRILNKSLKVPRKHEVQNSLSMLNDHSFPGVEPNQKCARSFGIIDKNVSHNSKSCQMQISDGEIHSGAELTS